MHTFVACMKNCNTTIKWNRISLSTQTVVAESDTVKLLNLNQCYFSECGRERKLLAFRRRKELQLELNDVTDES